MVRAKGAFRVLKLVAFALVVLVVALTAVSCGQKGKVYGDLVWDYTLLYVSYSGLFSSPSYGTVYQIPEGTYNYKYQNRYFDGYYYYYWPSVNTAYAGTYTVTAEPGGFPFTNGSDDYFELYASIYGFGKSGSGVSSIAPPANGSAPTVTPKLGTQTWTENGLRITVTTNIVNLSDEERATLKQGVHK